MAVTADETPRGRFRRGGHIPGDGRPEPVLIQPGERIETPERAEQVGLTVEAKRMRARRPDGHAHVLVYGGVEPGEVVPRDWTYFATETFPS
jgi:hypothetical protein